MRPTPKLPLRVPIVLLFAVLAFGCGGSDDSVGAGPEPGAIEDARGYIDDVAERIRADALEASEEARKRAKGGSPAPEAPAAPEAEEPQGSAAPEEAPEAPVAADDPEPAEGSARPGS